MVTIVINEKTEEGRSLMGVIRAIRRTSNAVVQILDEESEQIPGLPYTKEERLAAIHRAEEDYAAGRFKTSEEMKTKHPRP
ncbi:hypothetical protein LJC05_00110 [Bacteroides sp. OttesenSCG-928-J23]|nr:hypothetical protein [Bacteroides sp. OttesenSCG-928-J23]MDL2299240.1 hypothetical protein [Bacteroides sp. OttesenSCG-928-E20]MDL2304602.1 hypothetical protein [Bacteroides sp. OttesenSCG-928-D19]